MARVTGRSILIAILLLGTTGNVSAATDEPDRCSQIGSASPTGSWVSGTLESADDVDWFRFTVPKTSYLHIVLGSLPADYQMQVYKVCGDHRAYRSFRPGTEFEELVLRTYFDTTYMVRVASATGVWQSDPYQLRVRVLNGGLTLMSHRLFTDNAGDRQIVGEVMTSRSQYRRVRITASFHDSSGVLIGSTSTLAMLRELQVYERRRTPFRIIFDPPPGFDHYRLQVTGRREKSSGVRRLRVSQLTPYVDGESRGHFPGQVRNSNTFTINSLEVAVTLYDDRGRVLNVALADTNKQIVGAGGRALFDATFTDHFAKWNRWSAVAQAMAS